MLGGRASIINIHLKMISNNFMNDVTHYFLLPDKSRKKTIDICKPYENKFNFVPRESLTFNSKFPDSNYDTLLHKYCATDKFILLHDDTFINSLQLRKDLDDLMKKYDFGGAVDNAAIGQIKTPYRNIYFDGMPFSEIRLGTWFLFGDYSLYKDSNYTLGDGGPQYPIVANLKYRTRRISIKSLRVYIDGGFNFNINCRVDNRKIYTFKQSFGAEHFTRCTTFFVSRGLGKYIDSPEEVSIWENRLKKLSIDGNINQIKKDIYFMKKMASFLEMHDTYDALLNIKTINRLELLAPKYKGS